MGETIYQLVPDLFRHYHWGADPASRWIPGCRVCNQGLLGTRRMADRLIIVNEHGTVLFSDLFTKKKGNQSTSRYAYAAYVSCTSCIYWDISNDLPLGLQEKPRGHNSGPGVGCQLPSNLMCTALGYQRLKTSAIRAGDDFAMDDSQWALICIDMLKYMCVLYMIIY